MPEEENSKNEPSGELLKLGIFWPVHYGLPMLWSATAATYLIRTEVRFSGCTHVLS
jgi:hypothetical protein